MPIFNKRHFNADYFLLYIKGKPLEWIQEVRKRLTSDLSTKGVTQVKIF